MSGSCTDISEDEKGLGMDANGLSSRDRRRRKRGSKKVSKSNSGGICLTCQELLSSQGTQKEEKVYRRKEKRGKSATHSGRGNTTDVSRDEGRRRKLKQDEDDRADLITSLQSGHVPFPGVRLRVTIEPSASQSKHTCAVCNTRLSSTTFQSPVSPPLSISPPTRTESPPTRSLSETRQPKPVKKRRGGSMREKKSVRRSLSIKDPSLSDDDRLYKQISKSETTPRSISAGKRSRSRRLRRSRSQEPFPGMRLHIAVDPSPADQKDVPHPAMVPPADGSCGWDGLPDELLTRVLGFLPPEQLYTTAQVCTRWKKVSKDNVLWRTHYLRRWKTLNRSRENLDIEGDWASIFRHKLKQERNWRGGAYTCKTLRGYTDSIQALYRHKDGTMALAGVEEDAIVRWNLSPNGPQHVQRLQGGHTDTITCLQLDEQKLVSGSKDRTLCVWDLDQNQCVRTLQGHTLEVSCIHYDAGRNGKAVSGSADTTVRVWDMETGQCEHTFRGHSAPIRCMQYGPPQRIVTGSVDKTIIVWDTRIERAVQTLYGHTYGVSCLQFDDEKVLSGSSDRRIRLWDLHMARELYYFEGHTASVSCLQFDENKVVSGSLDKTIRVWDLKAKWCLNVLEGHQDGVRYIRFDQERLISSSADHTVKVWDFA